MKTIIQTALLITTLISGQAYGLELRGSQENHLYGDESFVDLYDSSTLYIHIGSSISYLNSYDDALTKIEGGDIGNINTYNKSKTEIRYVEDLSWLIVSDESEIKIFGSQFKYERGHLSGKWSNGGIFSFWALKGQGPGQPLLPSSNIMPSNIKLIYPPRPPLPNINLVPIYNLLISK